MSRLENFPIIRGLLLAFTLGATLTGCASDGRLDLKKLDFSRLQFKQPDWMRWERDKQASPPAAPSSQNSAAAGEPAAAPVAATQKISPIAATSASNAVTPKASYIVPASAGPRSLPRPKPGRAAAAASRTAPLAARKTFAEEVKEQPAKAPQGKVTTEIPQALAVLPPPAKAPRSEGKGGYSTNDLVGLDVPAIERLLGKPDLSRKEPFAEVWQYSHGGCVLFLFIYAEAGGAARVSHAETGARDGGEDPEPGQCIGTILSRNAAVPG